MSAFISNATDRDPALWDETIQAAWLGAVSRYTVGRENVERVIGLATDDILAALRPHVEAFVRDQYGSFGGAA